MKTTIDIADSLLARAKRHARKTGTPLRAVIEEGIRLVLEEPRGAGSYRLPDRSVGNPGAKNPLSSLKWQALRQEIYSGR